MVAVHWSMAAAKGGAGVGIIAHRGASFDAPENTLAAVNLAWQQGADAVEVDVMLAADGRVMVFHDATTKRLTGVDLPVTQTPSAQLRALDVGRWKGAAFAGERIPYIEEVVATIPPEKTLVVEIKGGGEAVAAVSALREAVAASGKLGQLVFIAFERDVIVACKEAFGQNDCYWLLDQAQWLLEQIRQAAAAGLSGVNLCRTIVTAEAMAVAADMGLRVLSWTVNDAAQALALRQLGVDAITTDRPQWLRQQLSA